MLRAESPAIGAYVLACLTQDLATEQLIRWNSGGTYPAIERSVPLDVWIPNPGESEIKDVGNSMLKIRRYVDEASALVRSAKSDIRTERGSPFVVLFGLRISGFGFCYCSVG